MDLADIYIYHINQYSKRAHFLFRSFIYIETYPNHTCLNMFFKDFVHTPMLLNINIKNFLLIEELNLDLD